MSRPGAVQLGETIRPVARYRPRIGTSMAVWWCPFCDNSQDEGRMDCAKCGAVLVTLSASSVAEVPLSPRGDVAEIVVTELSGGAVRKEAAEDIAAAPPPAAQAVEEAAPAPVRRPRARRTPLPKSKLNSRAR